MTVRDLFVRMRELVDHGFGDLAVKCDREVEWAWLISDDETTTCVELSLLKYKNELLKEDNE